MTLAAVHGLLRSLAVAMEGLRGRSMRRRALDRLFLEKRFLPAYAQRSDVCRVLFVGCARYTRDYAQLFEHVEYWTLDSQPRNSRWGSRMHIRDRLERLDRHVSDEYFDVIICNGVLGWGMNRREDAEAAFSACHRSLRAGGELVVGWNDVWPRNVVRPDDVAALDRFERCQPSGFTQSRIALDVPHRHVFDFYRKPFTAGQGPSVVGPGAARASSDSERPKTIEANG